MLRSAITCIGALVLIAFNGVPVQAQNADFSGTWTLDRDASELPQGRGGGPGAAGGGRRGGGGGFGGGGGGRGGFGGGGLATITITQSDGELVMEQQIGDQRQTITYRLDGGTSENPGPRGGMTTTMSSWDGAALITQGSQTMSTPRGEVTLETQERRTLSSDGQTITVAATRTTPRGEITTTLVYRKSAG